MGREYDVVELSLGPHAARLRVIDDDGQPTLWALEGFELADGRIPHGWIAKLDEDGSVTLSPPAFQEDGFWWSYFQDEAEARAKFEQIVKISRTP